MRFQRDSFVLISGLVTWLHVYSIDDIRGIIRPQNRYLTECTMYFLSIKKRLRKFFCLVRISFNIQVHSDESCSNVIWMILLIYHYRVHRFNFQPARQNKRVNFMETGTLRNYNYVMRGVTRSRRRLLCVARNIAPIESAVARPRCEVNVSRWMESAPPPLRSSYPCPPFFPPSPNII